MQSRFPEDEKILENLLFLDRINLKEILTSKFIIGDLRVQIENKYISNYSKI